MGELKVRFLPEGGFNERGAFIEYEGGEPTGEEAEYQRQSNLRLDIACSGLKVGTSLGVICEYEEVEERKYSRAIVATGVIQPSRWGQYELSFLGDKRTTHEIAISIRESPVGESATMAGIKESADLDLDEMNEFFLEIDVHHERFPALLEELSFPDAALRISAHAYRFQGFYAEWSPSISNGRVIKFLNRVRDVENADEIPKDFWLSSEFQRKLLSNLDTPPVTISVGRPLRPERSGPIKADSAE